MHVHLFLQQLFTNYYYISDSVTLMSEAEPVTRSCDEKALAAVNVTGKVALCFLPLEAAASPPGTAVNHALVGLFKAKAKGMIFAQYSNNRLDTVQSMCEQADLVCVLVDYQLAYRILVGYVADDAR